MRKTLRLKDMSKKDYLLSLVAPNPARYITFFYPPVLAVYTAWRLQTTKKNLSLKPFFDQVYAGRTFQIMLLINALTTNEIKENIVAYRDLNHGLSDKMKSSEPFHRT